MGMRSTFATNIRIGSVLLDAHALRYLGNLANRNLLSEPGGSNIRHLKPLT